MSIFCTYFSPVDSSADFAADNGNHDANSNSKWYHISDSHVKEVSEKSVLDCQAYILFYEKVK